MDHHGYPEDRKDPAVVVDMNEREDMPPPPFQDEATEPLLANEEKAQDPLSQEEQADQPRRAGRCLFAHLRALRERRRCNSEQRAQCKSKAKKFFRGFFKRLFAVLFIAWVYLSFFAEKDNENSYDLDFDSESYSDLTPSWNRGPIPGYDAATGLYYGAPIEDFTLNAEEECRKEQVPWDGPSEILANSDLFNLNIGVGKGNIVSNIVIKSSRHVHLPTIFIRANVTKIRNGDDDDDDNDDDDEGDVKEFKSFVRRVIRTRRGGDGGDDDEDDGDDDDDEDEDKTQGLHLKLTETDDKLDLQFWADSYIRPENGDDDQTPKEPDHKHPHKPHHRKHHRKHHRHQRNRNHHFGQHRRHGRHGGRHHRKHHDRNEDEEQDLERMMSMMMRKKRDDGFFSWGDRVESEQHQHQQRGQKFCASLDVEVVFPAHVKTFGTVTIGGVVASIKTEESLNHLVFEQLELHAVVGGVETVGDLKADVFNVGVVTGAVTVESIEASTGHPLNARVSSTVGNVEVNAKTGFVYVEEPEGDDGDNDGEEGEMAPCSHGEEYVIPHHSLVVSSVAGSIDANVAIIENEELSSEKISAPGSLDVRSGSSLGRVFTRVDLVEGRALYLNSGSTSGDVAAIVADTFLGEFDVKALLGSTSVEEAGSSHSVIEYEKSTTRVKKGRKVIRNEGDDTPETVGGAINIGTTFGQAALQFIDGEDDMWKADKI